MAAKFLMYKGTMAMKGSNLFDALENGDSKKAEELFQESRIAEEKRMGREGVEILKRVTQALADEAQARRDAGQVVGLKNPEALHGHQ